jgi:hypothetical protein
MADGRQPEYFLKGHNFKSISATYSKFGQNVSASKGIVMTLQ